MKTNRTASDIIKENRIYWTSKKIDRTALEMKENRTALKMKENRTALEIFF